MHIPRGEQRCRSGNRAFVQAVNEDCKLHNGSGTRCLPTLVSPLIPTRSICALTCLKKTGQQPGSHLQNTSKPSLSLRLPLFSNLVVLVLLFARHRQRRRAVSGRWSCCGKVDAAATGCAPRPHKPKETMLSVRAEGGPPVLVGNTEVCRATLFLLITGGCACKAEILLGLGEVRFAASSCQVA